jgi:hypothetical protein
MVVILGFLPLTAVISGMRLVAVVARHQRLVENMAEAVVVLGQAHTLVGMD